MTGRRVLVTFALVGVGASYLGSGGEGNLSKGAPYCAPPTLNCLYSICPRGSLVFFAASDGHGEDRVCLEARLQVHLFVETRVGVHVRYVFHLRFPARRSGHAGRRRKASMT